MAPPSANKRKKSVAKQPKRSVNKTSVTKKSVTKKSVTKKSVTKKSVTKTSVSKKPEKSVGSSGWKKPASKRSLDPSGPLLRSKCHFFKLPLELRFMIYSDLVRSKDLELLLTCQRIHKEALEVLYRDGIYIVDDYGTCAFPRYEYGGRRSNHRESIGDEFQNVEIWTDLSNFLSPGEKNEAIDYLGAHYPELRNLQISRNTCWIQLRAHRSLLGEPHLGEGLAVMLRALRAFDNVFLNITEVIHLGDVFQRYNGVSEFGSRFKTLGNLMEPSSGPSTWHDSPDKEKRYWVFHPRQVVGIS